MMTKSMLASPSSSGSNASPSTPSPKKAKKPLSQATVSQYESYVNSFRTWCKQSDVPAEYRNTADNVTYHTPRAMLAWAEARMANADLAKQAGTAVSARSAFLWWYRKSLGVERSEKEWSERRLPDGSWAIDGNPVKWQPYEDFIDKLKLSMPKRIFRPRKRDLIAAQQKARSSASSTQPHQLRMETLTNGMVHSSSSDGSSAPASTHGDYMPSVFNSSSSSSHLDYMSEAPSSGSSTSSVGTSASTAATTAIDLSPVWPHGAVLSPKADDCLCDTSFFSNPENAAPHHSYRCRYGAIMRRDLDAMIFRIDYLLQDSLLADSDRVRLEWLRAFLYLSFYLWAL